MIVLGPCPHAEKYIHLTYCGFKKPNDGNGVPDIKTRFSCYLDLMNKAVTLSGEFFLHLVFSKWVSPNAWSVDVYHVSITNICSIHKMGVFVYHYFTFDSALN